MREIKFRAWDKRNKKMVKVMRLWFPMEEEEKTVNPEIEYWEDNNDESYDIETFILMQYTGLKDKNGVEIYEGDIIKWYFTRYPSARKQKRIDEVKFIMGAFVPDVWRNQEYEVIGNIYEKEDK